VGDTRNSEMLAADTAAPHFFERRPQSGRDQACRAPPPVANRPSSLRAITTFGGIANDAFAVFARAAPELGAEIRSLLTEIVFVSGARSKEDEKLGTILAG
jgi:hypothetical protein